MPAQGRATVEMQIKLKEARQEGVAGGLLKIVVDGYNAPVTGGNFVDLVQRGFYNNMEIQRADGFVVQTGDPGPPVRAAASRCGGLLYTWGVRSSGFKIQKRGPGAQFDLALWKCAFKMVSHYFSNKGAALLA